MLGNIDTNKDLNSTKHFHSRNINLIVSKSICMQLLHQLNCKNSRVFDKVYTTIQNYISFRAGLRDDHFE